MRMAASAVSRTRGQVVNIASGEEVSINRLVRELMELLGLQPEILHEEGRPGDVRRHCGATARARELLGFTPATDLRTGLAETVDWYRTSLPTSPLPT